ALTVLQIALTFAVVLALTRLGANTTGDANLPVAPRRFFTPGKPETALDAALILLALLFVAGPMAATVAAGLDADLMRLAGESAVRQATLTSVVLALLSALLSAALSLALVMARRALALGNGT